MSTKTLCRQCSLASLKILLGRLPNQRTQPIWSRHQEYAWYKRSTSAYPNLNSIY